MPTVVLIWAIAILAGLVALGYFARWAATPPFNDVEMGLTWRALWVYAKLVHGLRLVGREHIPQDNRPGPLLVVANHTAGVDPVLIQAVCPFKIRWMMAEDMRLPALERFWQWARVIFVDRDAPQMAAAREALRHLKDGGVIGIFPEGRIERPEQTILPFASGVGLIARRAGARILPVIISGTPQVDPAWRSLWWRSKAQLEFKAPIEYDDRRLNPDHIAQDLRARYLEWTGWPADDSPRHQPDVAHPLDSSPSSA